MKPERTLSPVVVSRLEKAAVDNGFDQELPQQTGEAGAVEWLGFASTQCPLRIWLGMTDDKGFVAALSQQNVARALTEFGTIFDGTLPVGAVDGRRVTDIPALHHLIRRAFQLSKTLPDELLHRFMRATGTLPRTTEAERLVVQRVGQDIFRAGLIDYWDGRCAITGLSIPEMLRASHIKPWADCERDSERLDVFNGLLLAPHLDAAFDAGLITVMDDGFVKVSSALGKSDLTILSLADALYVRSLADGHRSYLSWHRTKVFR
jgi:hypothetical protein